MGKRKDIPDGCPFLLYDGKIGSIPLAFEIEVRYND